MKRLLTFAASIGLCLFAARAEAGAGRATNVDASGRFTVVNWTQPAYSTATIETTALQGTVPDTVLYVFDAAAPSQYFAGNDDRAVGDYGSLVTITNNTSVAKSRIVVVRAFAANRNGTGTLKISTNTGVLQSWSIVFDGGTQVPLGSYAAQMHVVGVEQQRGAGDVVALLADQAHASRAYATAFDNDAALGLMPFIHANQSCSSGNSCVALVGRPWSPGDSMVTSFVGSPTTTIVWDPDMHAAWADPDDDGLSTALETAIGTSPTNDDTDRDGLKDGLELLGGNEGSAGSDWRQVRYPYFGALPLQKDLFVQADWNRCDFVPGTASESRCIRPGEAAGSFDRFRVTGTDAEKIVANYAPANISVHLDIGVDPPRFGALPRAVSYAYGAWDGAQQRVINDDHCQFQTGVRVGAFHYLKINGTSGGQANTPGPCGSVSVAPWDIAHELGHNVNQDHMARFAGSSLNGAPNYVSIMNYPYSKDKGGATLWPFADGTYNNWDLNPQAMDEMAPVSAELVSILQSKFKYTIDSNNRVDWNRDGWLSPAPIRAETSWFYDLGSWKQQKFVPTSVADSFTPGSALAWVGASAGQPARLLWYVRKQDHLVLFSAQNQFPTAACPTCSASWNADPWLLAPAVTGVSGAPAAARLSRGGAEEALVAVPTDNGSIVVYRGGWHVYTATFSQFEWTPTVLKAANTAPTVTGGLAMLVDGDDVLTYATTFAFGDGFKVHEYRWNLATNAVTDTVVTSGGSPILPDGNGVGVTMGYAPPNPGAFGAVVRDRVLVVPVRQASPVDGTSLYRSSLRTYLRRAGDWVELPEIASESTFGAQPSIAYVPFEPSTPEVGRFYVTFRSSQIEGTAFANDRRFHMIYSEGNQPVLAPYRRMAWPNHSAEIGNEWNWVEANVALSYDPLFFPRLQMAYNFFNDGKDKHFYEAQFSPYADNIVPEIARSQSDRPSMRGALRCSLRLGDCECLTRTNGGCE